MLLCTKSSLQNLKMIETNNDRFLIFTNQRAEVLLERRYFTKRDIEEKHPTAVLEVGIK